MKLLKTAMAGTMESGDIMVTIVPLENGGITLDLTSSVMQQYGRRIGEVIRETLGELGVTNAAVSAVDKGALDCTVRARVSAAAFRCAQAENDHWGGSRDGKALCKGSPAPEHDVCSRQQSRHDY